MKLPIVTLAFLVATGAACTNEDDTFALRGKVSTEVSKQAINQVDVLVDGRLASQTDANGVYSIQGLSGGESVTLDHCGYEPHSFQIEKPEEGSITRDVELTPTVLRSRIVSNLNGTGLDAKLIASNDRSKTNRKGWGVLKAVCPDDVVRVTAKGYSGLKLDSEMDGESFELLAGPAATLQQIGVWSRSDNGREPDDVLPHHMCM